VINIVDVIGIIPARYKSTRFEGKPLADICGKPMIWWVYNEVKKVEGLTYVLVATDDRRIERVCERLNVNVLMTSDKHLNPTDRIYEVSTRIDADLTAHL
jgi:3-deoxy-manno-octulosonate cytidylyltransferase (CMP-KDO synthetase)